MIQVGPRISDQLPHLEEDLHLLPRETEREMESGLALVNRKSPCVIKCLHVMWQPVVPRQLEGTGQHSEDGEKECDKDWQGSK